MDIHRGISICPTDVSRVFVFRNNQTGQRSFSRGLLYGHNAIAALARKKSSGPVEIMQHQLDDDTPTTSSLNRMYKNVKAALAGDYSFLSVAVHSFINSTRQGSSLAFKFLDVPQVMSSFHRVPFVSGKLHRRVIHPSKNA